MILHVLELPLSVAYGFNRALIIILLIHFTRGGNIDKTSVVQETSCYYCMSPASNIVAGDTREAVITLWTDVLKHLPEDQTQECNTLTNVSILHTQKCASNFCVKYLIDDKDSSPFVIRICADEFKISDSNLREGCKKEQLEWSLVGCICQGHLCNSCLKVASNFLLIFLLLVINVFSLLYRYQII